MLLIAMYNAKAPGREDAEKIGWFYLLQNQKNQGLQP